ncbi:DUF2326 domain-containing protein [Rahnella sp. R3(2024)]|uniref:DUF2326 domain-containing protein n=1 Tax=Rahnella sp. R3(2024) TaxID=3163550 RepID=UPI0036EC092D
MIKINKLYSEPFSFEPVEFKSGINLILGEKDITSNKTNGVGKSLLIEFINFTLMKDFKRSRLAKIPTKDFSHEIKICLDFNIDNNNIICKRSIIEESSPTLYVNGIKKTFSSIEDATKFLTLLMFKNDKISVHPSFRSMLGPLIRDERSEFKSIIDCYDTKSRVPADYTPHLYLFGININLYREIKGLQKTILDLSTAKKKLKEDIESITGKKLANARAEVNDLDFQLKKIKKEMDMLEGDKTFDMIRDEVSSYEDQLDVLRNKRTIIKAEINKINLLVGDNYIDDREVIELYNNLRAGLGDNIGKELSEVIRFKRKIDDFQRTLIDSRKETLSLEIEELDLYISEIVKNLHSKTSILKQSGQLRNIKVLFLAYEKKLEELSQLSMFIKKYDDYELKSKVSKAEKSSKTLELDLSISNQKSTISEFQETIFSIHEYVMENRKCSFDISVSDKKEVLNFDLRIFDDGSHSNEREKVFFYDIALLLTHDTFIRHPKILIHDNIFDVDHDTLIKSLNYLSEKSSCLEDVQYILTLNSDKISAIDKDDLKLDIDLHRRATLTKSNRFLGRSYQEK